MNTKNKQLKIILILAVLIAIVGLVTWEVKEGELSWPIGRSQTFDYLDQSLFGLAETVSEPTGPTNQPAVLPDYNQTYVSTDFGFRFRFPENLRFSTFAERNGQMILANSATGAGNAFQIFISPFDEPADSLTPDRLRQDLPDLVVKKPEVFKLADRASGLAFVSDGPPFGESREVWFVYQNHLYQISAYLDNDALLQNILRTWRFE
ncbi:MAG: hypothetical protein WDZ85_03640 [Candidatus Paceibacterota bacterium]